MWGGGGWGWDVITKIKANLSSTEHGLNSQLELSLAISMLKIDEDKWYCLHLFMKSMLNACVKAFQMFSNHILILINVLPKSFIRS